MVNTHKMKRSIRFHFSNTRSSDDRVERREYDEPQREAHRECKHNPQCVCPLCSVIKAEMSAVLDTKLAAPR